jgi:hypothetical protein
MRIDCCACRVRLVVAPIAAEANAVLICHVVGRRARRAAEISAARRRTQSAATNLPCKGTIISPMNTVLL